MDEILISNSWLSLEHSIEPMQRITSKTRMSANDVLSELINKRLKASVCITSTPLLLWPMVKLTGDDAAKFQRDEQSTETYRGKSFAVDGGLLAPHREVTPLTGGRILDLPLTTSNRAFLQDLKKNPVPVGKSLRLPRGTLLEIPDTGDYFVTVDELNMPDVFCEIVIRTAVLIDFERRLIEFKKGAVSDGPIPLSSMEAATPAPVVAETPKQRRARWLDLYGEGERGAVQRVYERELLTNPKADRSNIGKEIKKAKQEKKEAKQGGRMFSQLVQDGKRV